MKKRCAIICAEVVRAQGYTSWDCGCFQLAHDMYDECIKQGAMKISKLKHRHHPLNVNHRISQILAEDCKRRDGVWLCDKTLTYPGILKKPVKFYELRRK